MFLLGLATSANALCGDINGDGLIDASDRTAVAGWVAGASEPSAAQRLLADVALSGSAAAPDGFLLSNDLALVFEAARSALPLFCDESGLRISGTAFAPHAAQTGLSDGNPLPNGSYPKKNLIADVFLVNGDGIKTGPVVQRFASGAAGAFAFTLPQNISPSSSLVVSSGSGVNLARAIVHSQSIELSPLSEWITGKIIASSTSLDNFSNAEIAAILSLASDLTASIDLSPATTISQAVAILEASSARTRIDAAITAAGSNSSDCEPDLPCGETPYAAREPIDIVAAGLPGGGSVSAVRNQKIVLLSANADISLLENAAAAAGTRIISRSAALGLFLIEVPDGNIEQAATIIGSVPGASAAIPNAVFPASALIPDDPPFSDPAQAEQRRAFEIISAPEAWEKAAAYPGRPSIAILDTGIDSSSPDLAGNISNGADFISDGAQLSDSNGHGTHIAGIVAAKGNNAAGIAGVCWNCVIMPVKVCDSAGNCPLFSIVKGFEFAADNGAKIINTSFSGQAQAGADIWNILKIGIDYATARGILTVSAAGNNAADASNNIPASIPGVLAVAATDNNDALAVFSATGGMADIAAPGTGVYSLGPNGTIGAKSGTSAAAAFVSGAAGLLLSKTPALAPDEITSMLRGSADVVPGSGAINGGRLNLSKALDAASGVPGSTTECGAQGCGTAPGGETGITTAAATCPVVSSTADSGAGTLRDCITYANSNPGTVITFDPTISGQTISPLTLLPAVIQPDITIDGGSQNITISGLSCPSTSCSGLTIGNAATAADNTVIKSLTISGFRGNGIFIYNGDNVTIGGADVTERNIIIGNGTTGGTYAGIYLRADASGVIIRNNYIGVMADGATVSANRNGIYMLSSPSMNFNPHIVDGNVISGNTNYGVYDGSAGHFEPGTTYTNNIVGLTADASAPAQNNDGIYLKTDQFIVGQPGNGNTISCNKNYGLYVGDFAGAGQIKGNYIGTSATGNSLIACGANPQDYGIYSYRNFIAIGGDKTLGEYNVIGGNSNTGIYLQGNFSINIMGNYIGTDPSGAVNLGNSQYGIRISGDAFGTLGIGIGDPTGANDPVFSNTIAYNTTAGIYIDNLTANPPMLNSVYNNSIYSNGGPANKAILLAAGAHDSISAPNISSITCGSADGLYNITATYTNPVAAPSTVFLYRADNTAGNPAVSPDSVGGEGFMFLGMQTDNGAAGAKTMTFTDIPISDGSWVSSYRYNDLQAGGGVSEFGANRQLPNCGASTCPSVTSLADSGSDTLRDCIERANSDGTPTAITFGTAGVITLNSSLPALTENGSTINGAGMITISGGGTATDGFIIQSTNNAIRNLAIVNFASAAIVLSGAATTGNTIEGNLIGIDSSSAAQPNKYGIALISAPGNTIGGSAPSSLNVISGNTDSGILVSGPASANNSIKGNYIGTNAAGGSAVSNTAGIKLLNGAHNNTVGGTAAGEANLIAFNSTSGISAAGSSTDFNSFRRNRIFSNGSKGISLDGAGSNNNIQPPSISSVINTGSSYNITGTATCPSYPCIVELYRADHTPGAIAADAGGGEGYEYLGSTTIASGAAFSFSNFSVSSNGTKITTVLTDNAGNSSEFGANATLPPPNSAPSVASVLFTPNSIQNDGITTTTVTAIISDANGLSDISAVRLDFSEINGDSNVTLYDDGFHGDGAANDGTYGNNALTAPVSAVAKSYTLYVRATDTSGAAASASAAFAVTATPAAPPDSPCGASWPSFLCNRQHASKSSGTMTLPLAVKWIFNTGGNTLSSPAVVNGRVFIGSDDKKLYALDAITGLPVWTYTTGGIIRSSPAVSGGLVFFGSNDSKFYALDENDGHPVWSSTTVGIVDNSPVVSNGKVIFGSLNTKVYSLDASNGNVYWTTTLGNTISSSPAVYNGKVYIGSRDFKLYSLSETSGAQLWNYNTGSQISSSPSVADGKVFISAFNGTLYAVDENTHVPAWQYNTSGQSFSSPVSSDGKVYFLSNNGTIHAFNTNSNVPIWQKTGAAGSISSPVSADGKIFNVQNNIIFGRDAATGNELWRYTATNVIHSTPAIYGNRLYIGTNDSKIYCFETNQSPTASGITFTPSTLLSDGVSTTTVTVTINDPNSRYDISTVQIDLSSIGGSSTFTLYDDGLHGDGAASDGLYGGTNIIATYAKPTSSYPVTVTVRDVSNTSGSANGTISIQGPTCPVVSRTNDSGMNTLRDCISYANTNPGASITFDSSIAGQTIRPVTALPSITAANTVIDGGSNNITIDGSLCANCSGLAVNANSATIKSLTITSFQTHGIDIAAGTGSTIGGTTAVSRNVIINNGNAAAEAGIRISSTANGVTIRNNYIGVNSTGSTAAPNYNGIYIQSVSGALNTVRDNVISGNTFSGIYDVSTNVTSPGNTFTGNIIGLSSTGLAAAPNQYGIYTTATRNVIGQAGNGNTISCNSFYGIYIVNSTAAAVQGNRIGTNASGSAASACPNPQDYGIYARNSAVTIGGSLSAGQGNVIAASSQAGIMLQGTSNAAIKGNAIGSNFAFGATATGTVGFNNNYGIWLSGDAMLPTTGNAIGDASLSADSINYIAYNDAAGIYVDAAGTPPVSNFAYNNKIYNNGGSNIKGILLAPGAHGGISAPSINKISCGDISGQYKVTVAYKNTIATSASTVYLYLADNPSGNPTVTADSTGGEGFSYIASAAGSGAAGTQTVVFANLPVSGGTWMSSYRANSAAGVSEFSANYAIPPCIETCPVVSSIDDTGPGSLRRCITSANLTPGTSITFDSSISGGTILPETELPAITADSTTIDGGGNDIEISGDFPCANCRGLVIDNAANCEIKKLTIVKFTGTPCDDGTQPCAAIQIKGGNASNNIIRSNIIGTNSANSTSMRNQAGILINGGAKNNTIGGSSAADRNVISNNLISGISITGSGTDGNKIFGNYIGLNNAGSAILSSAPPQTTGISITGSAKNTQIGSSTAQKNIISGSATEISLAGPGIDFTQVNNNNIGTDATGNNALAGGATHILIDNAANIKIGGDSTLSEGNIISGAPVSGARYCIVARNNSSSIEIRGNKIGVLANGAAASAPAASIGILLQNTSSTIIGGSSAGDANTIGGNTGYGIRAENSNSPRIQGNFIGTNSTAAANLANSIGIHLTNGTTNALIGGIAAGEANTLRHNTANAITTSGATTNFNNWLRNRIYNSGGAIDKGIAISGGSNQSIAKPSITYSAKTGANTFDVTGTSSCMGCSIELFRADDTASGIVKDTPGGEAFEFIGTATTDALTGAWTVANATVNGGTWVSAIVTSPSGNSSEFSDNAEAANKQPSITSFTLSPASIPADGLTTTLLTATVTDPNGTADINRVTVDISSINSALGIITLYDTGAPGSGIAGDGIFAAYATAANGNLPGNRPLIATAFDNWELSTTSTKMLTIINSPPSISNVSASPTEIIAGYFPVSFKATASDPNGLNDISSVYVNLAPIGGPAAFALFDNGANNDDAAGDGVFGAINYTAPMTLPGGFSTLTYRVVDTSGASGTATFSIYVNRPPSVTSFSFNPPSIPANGIAASNAQLTLTDPDALTDIVSVSIELSAIGAAPATQLMLDDGSQGDGTALDGVYGLAGIIPASGTAEADYNIRAAIADRFGRIIYATASLNVSNITPRAPALISAVNASGTIVLTWRSPSLNTNGFPLADLNGHKVWRKISGGSYATTPVFIDTTTATNTLITYSDPAVSLFTTYCYTVSAYNSSNVHSAVSGEICIAPVPDPWTFSSACGVQVSGSYVPPGSPGYFDRPSDAAVDASGNIFVADMQNHRIQKFDSNCIFKGATGTLGLATGTFKSPSSIAFNKSDGFLYVVDANNRVTVLDTTDALNVQMDKGFTVRYPLYIRAGTDGSLYISSDFDKKVKNYSTTGAVIKEWQFTSPKGIDVDSAGNLFVADSTMHMVYKISGTATSTWGSYGAGYTEFNSPMGIAVDRANNLVFIADTNNDRVKIYDTDGNLKNVIGTTGAALGELRRPGGASPTNSGGIAIADKYNNRIQIFIPPAP